MYSIPSSTGSSSSQGSVKKAAFVMIGTLLIGTGTVYGMDRAEHWREHVKPRVPFEIGVFHRSGESAGRPDIRTAAQHLENVRKVLNPNISDLGAMFEVSRQMIYRWISGVSTPEPDKLIRIGELSRIADTFFAAEIARPDALLKMKTFDGRSLMDLFKAAEGTGEQVDALIAEAKAMKASYISSGLTASKSKPSNDWQSSISIPGSSERY
jgi:transcriptional regulator with XRE-family HTH domain